MDLPPDQPRQASAVSARALSDNFPVLEKSLRSQNRQSGQRDARMIRHCAASFRECTDWPAEVLQPRGCWPSLVTDKCPTSLSG